ncbi:MAG: tRNA 4-thiouridine(8) synthase ThiI [Lachnospiraceae bacterium]|nr:tRNA 4-thiouridine(8) synthase ThiI [Lachnospiraceae bacterium]
MSYQSFLIKYGEIGIKGKNRYLFEDALVDQIRFALKDVDGIFHVRKTDGRIFAEVEGAYDYDGAVEALSKVFGIVRFCPVKVTSDEGFEALSDAVCAHIEETYEKKDFTFKVETRRARKNYPKQSMEVNADLGERILETFPGTRVDVHTPEVRIHVEIRNEISIYSEEIEGPCGMPVGTSGKAMLLLSGGIDSPVAGYMTAKRGVQIEAVYFHAPPYTSDRAKQKVIDLAKIISVYTGPMKLYVVNFTDIQLAIYEHCPHDELTIIMRRFMMQIAEHFAKADDCLGLITGESIGQVASQTMQALFCTDDAATLPVYRPLIAFDKQDIVHLSEQIGTYETSILPYEDCCTIFVAKHPVTKPRLDRIVLSEQKLDGIVEPLVEKALSDVEIVEI